MDVKYRIDKDALMLRKIFSRRKHPRFHAKQKTYLVIQPYTPNEQKVQILDISDGGCGFIYTGDEKDLEEAGLVSLMSDSVPYIERINFSTVNDQPVSGPFRRRGVEFKWLGSMDKKKLKRFIQDVSLAKC